MKSLSILFIPIFIIGCASGKNRHFVIESPDKNIVATVTVSPEGIPFYSVSRNKQVIIEDSRLGITREDMDFSDSLTVRYAGKPEFITEVYTLIAGKRKNCTYKAERRTFRFVNIQNEEMEIVFQLSNDGVAFCYRFTQPSEEMKNIIAENTSFNFPEDSKAWLHPQANAQTGWCHVEPCYEMHYYQDISVGIPAPFEAGWSFPALFRVKESWILITESGLGPDYCGSRLSQQSPGGEYFITFPQKGEQTAPDALLNPQSALPWQTPWRVIVIGSLKEIVENTVVTDLARPSVISDASFVVPGRASWSWVLLKDDSIVYDVQKKFIDFAADMGWEYCLIDVNWDQKIGYEKIRELAEYAVLRDVGIILWYNSSGDWNTTTYTPKNLMFDRERRREEFKRISEMGIKGVKVDFWAGDGQSVIEYYDALLRDAAEFRLMVNCHGATIPRGWERTYPNLVTMEAVKGFEYVTFEQANADSAATHCAMLPFTRNAIGPMDYTPVCFSEIPRIDRRTSNAFELALSVLFQSGIQHYAEKPEGMLRQPGYVKDFLRELPGTWDDIRFIDGYPGRYVIIARKSSGRWFVAGINSMKEPRSFQLDLSGLAVEGRGTFITDGETDRSFSKKDMQLKNGMINLTIQPSGGFLMSLD
jgi:alpha-glucosidase